MKKRQKGAHRDAQLFKSCFIERACTLCWPRRATAGTVNARGKLLSLKCSARSTTVEVCGLADGNAMLSLSLSVPPASPPLSLAILPSRRAVVQRGVREYSDLDGGMGGLDGHCIVRHNDAFYSWRNSYASSATFRLLLPRALLKRAFEGKNLEIPPVCPCAIVRDPG